MLKQKLEVVKVSNEHHRIHVVAVFHDDSLVGETRIWVPYSPENAKRFYVGAIFTLCVD